MAMFPALMNDTMFSDLFDDPFFEGWRNMDRAAACDPNMSAGMMSTDVRETDKGYMVDIDMPGFKKDSNPPAKSLRHQPFQRFHRHLASLLPTFCPHSAKKANRPSSPTNRPDHRRRDRRKHPMSWRPTCAPTAFARS